MNATEPHTRAGGQRLAGPDPAGGAWTEICELRSIVVDTGVAALVDGHQVAVFRLGDGRVLAVDHHDPCSGANVLARGIVGDAEGRPVVASPIHKQRFDLTTGRCLDTATEIATHHVRVVDGCVAVRLGTGSR